MMYQIGMAYVCDIYTKAHELYEKATGLFRAPYVFAYTITPQYSSCVVRFMLVNDHEVAYVSVVYQEKDMVRTAVCQHVDSVIGHRVGSFLFLLQYRLAMECGVRLFTLDNMTDDPPRAARGIYSLLIWEEGREGEEILQAYLDHMEGRRPRPGHVEGALSGPEMVGVPYIPDSRLVARAWNVALRRLGVQTLWSRENPWSPHVREGIKRLFLSYHPMTLRFLPSL